MKFTKMHGCGNDYVYVSGFTENIPDRPSLSIQVSDRHFGIGSDGLICIDPSSVADFRMDMYNADGSRSQMCGNGIRCVGKYVYDHGLTDKTVITVETGAGIKTLWLNVGDDNKVRTVRVCMGAPEFCPAKIPVAAEGEDFILRPYEIAGQTWELTAVSMGNPHVVTFVPDVASLDLETIGPQFENHPLFPERVNTEFIRVIDRRTLEMRVWERGSGETLACGTGACASLAAAVRAGLAEDSARLILLGGELQIEWSRDENLIYMTGPAETVFEGIY
ncbi:MAG: diaminopimelate epimerase [Eubacteriales bacterium]|nr:diaminopimelate epimerase [Eubacteriales bacterium]